MTYFLKPPYQAYIYTGHTNVIAARYSSLLSLRQGMVDAMKEDAVNAIFYRGPKVAGAWDRDKGEMIFRGRWR